MHAQIASDPKLIRRYEGVVRKTAAMTVEHCDEDFDDICQLFRIKVWKALLSYDPTKVKNEVPDTYGRTPRDRYVFACIKNQAKDLKKRVKRNVSYIEEMTERFEAGYLGTTEEEIFHMIEESAPLIPSTLSDRERKIVTLLYLDFDNGEIGEQLGIQRKQVATLVRGIREKMADWAPTGWQAVPLVLPAGEPLAVAA